MSRMILYNISQSVLGTFHQGNNRFGYTSGSQCACNSLFSIFWSNIRGLSSWASDDLDKLLIEGDRIYKSLNTLNYLSVDDLPNCINFNRSSYPVNLLELHTSEANLVPGYPFLRTIFGDLSHCKSCLMFVNNYTIAIFQFQNQAENACYIFDSHSRDERGLFVNDGNSVLLKFENLSSK